jgi:hypothetical protein
MRPLRAERRRADDERAGEPVGHHHLAHDDCRLDRLPQPHIVRDQDAEGAVTEDRERGLQLIGQQANARRAEAQPAVRIRLADETAHLVRPPPLRHDARPARWRRARSIERQQQRPRGGGVHAHEIERFAVGESRRPEHTPARRSHCHEIAGFPGRHAIARGKGSAGVSM